MTYAQRARLRELRATLAKHGATLRRSTDSRGGDAWVLFAADGRPICKVAEYRAMNEYEAARVAVGMADGTKIATS